MLVQILECAAKLPKTSELSTRVHEKVCLGIHVNAQLVYSSRWDGRRSSSTNQIVLMAMPRKEIARREGYVRLGDTGSFRFFPILLQRVDVHLAPACMFSKKTILIFFFANCQKCYAKTFRTNLQLPEAKNLPSELTQEHRRPLLSFNAAFVTPFGGILLQRKPEMST
jgi:hypothetical protein